RLEGPFGLAGQFERPDAGGEDRQARAFAQEPFDGCGVGAFDVVEDEERFAVPQVGDGGVEGASERVVGPSEGLEQRGSQVVAGSAVPDPVPVELETAPGPGSDQGGLAASVETGEGDEAVALEGP